MNILSNSDPIIACSTTTQTNTAISIIRLSGFENLICLQSFFTKDLASIEPRKIYQSNLTYKEKILDKIIFAFFQAPQSYNGENILELYVHGNRLNIKRIINSFIEEKLFREASPGEFTLRALKNKKMNLSQVEGLDLLLNANSGFALNQGMELLYGDLNQKYNDLYNKFLEVRSSLDLLIDFSEDYGEEEGKKLFRKKLEELETQLRGLNEKTSVNSASLLSPSITLIGETNAGKSTLFNSFLKHNRSIISPFKGTTRDYISEIIPIEGNDFTLIDTAGLRVTDNEIEKEGIERTLKLLEKSFYNILVVNPFSSERSYFELIKHTKFDLVILTRGDFENKILSYDQSNIRVEYNKQTVVNQVKPPLNNVVSDNGPIGAENNGSIGAENSGSIGAENSGSIGAEKSDIQNRGESDNKPPFNRRIISSEECILFVKNDISRKHTKITQENPILLERHQRIIKESNDALSQFIQTINTEQDIAILSSELKIIESHLSELIGIITPEKVLDSIFANFCIGK